MNAPPASPPSPPPAPPEVEAIEPSAAAAPAATGAPAPAPRPRGKKSLADKIEAYISRLSTRNHFWHRVCSLIWLPYAFRSGIRMKQVDEKTFSATLPFRRFNRNWYNAMAGAALLGNSEIAGGAYVFGVCGGDYEVVCKHLEYKFLRPCFGPAEYRITPQEDVPALVASGTEFNITIDMEIVQTIPVPKSKRDKRRPKRSGDRLVGKAKRVGRCTATFHVTPKQHQKSKKRRR